MKKNLQSRLAIAFGVLGLMPMCTLMTESGKSYAKWQEGNVISPLTSESRNEVEALAHEGQKTFHHHHHPRREMY